MTRTRFFLALAVLFALAVTACADAPTDPCEDADQIIETPMTGTATGDTVAIVTICVFQPEA